MPDEYAIELAKTEYRDAFNAGDVERVLALYADNLTEMSDGEASFWGAEARQALRWRLGKMFAQNKVSLAVTIIAIEFEGSTAYDHGWHKLTLTPKNGGAASTQRYRYFEKWRREPDGQWKICFFISNRDVEPQMFRRCAFSSFKSIICW